MTYHHRDYGHGRLVLDETTLRPLDRLLTIAPEYPAELNRLQSEFPGMAIQRADDLGDSGDKEVRFVLQWETLGSNNDRARSPPLPEPGMLRLHRLAANRIESMPPKTAPPTQPPQVR